MAVAKVSDDLYLGVKGLPNTEIAGSTRKVFKYWGSWGVGRVWVLATLRLGCLDLWLANL